MALDKASGQPGPMQPGDFSSQSQVPAVIFKLRDLDPPSALYIQRDDEFVLSISSTLGVGTPIAIFARMLLPNGTIVPILRQFVTTQADPTPDLFPFSLTEGFLLSITLNSSSSGAPGLTYARVWVNRGKVNVFPRNSVETLIAGYVLSDTPLGWPYGVQLNSVTGGGALLQGSVGNPPAGSDFSIGAITFTRRRISSFAAQLVTSATVANRIVRAQIKQGGAIVYQGPPNAVVAASQTVIVSFAPGNSSTVADPLTVRVELPSPCILATNQSIQISTTNIAAGDQWSAITLAFEQWIDEG